LKEPLGQLFEEKLKREPMALTACLLLIGTILTLTRRNQAMTIMPTIGTGRQAGVGPPTIIEAHRAILSPVILRHPEAQRFPRLMFNPTLCKTM